MAEAYSEVSGYYLTADQNGKLHIVVEHSEYLSQPRKDRWKHMWRRYVTTNGIRLERMEDGVYLSVNAPTLKLQQVSGHHRLSPAKGTSLDV